MPTTHETSLDFTLIEELSHYEAPRRLGGSWIVRLRTHYLGGGRHFGQWEIADIGIILVVRERGIVRVRKVALLQSKRLYPDEQNFEEDIPLDYVIGFSRLMVDDEEDLSGLADRQFHFGPESRYKALDVAGKQWHRISQFESLRGVPVHLLLYHPLALPWRRAIPVEAGAPNEEQAVEIGARVLRTRDLRQALVTKAAGRSYFPSFADVASLNQWSLEGFVADEVLGCREGYVATGSDDDALATVFNRRTGPIAASLSITIDRI